MFSYIRKYSTSLILISVFLSIILAIYIPTLFDQIQFIGDLFINFLKLFALPLICSALIAALGEMGGNLSGFKGLARNTIAYMLLSEIIAVTIALILFNSFSPGVGLSSDLILHGSNYAPTGEQHFNLSTFFLSIFPHNIFESLARFDLLPVVIFSIIFGIACSVIGEKSAPIVNLAKSIRDVSNTCLHGVILLAPFGIFSLVGKGVAQSHLSGNLHADFKALLSFVVVLFLGLFLHALWQLVLVVLITKQNAINIVKESLPLFATAFGTSSSVATLPVAMETADKLMAKPIATRFMLPLCASINVGGMMMYEVAAALFFSQMLGLDLPLSQQILLAAACILGGMAEGGIPETSLVSLVVVFKIVNVPLSAISILLPLDRIIDRVRTMVNIFGNTCGAIVVSKFSTEISYEKGPLEK